MLRRSIGSRIAHGLGGGRTAIFDSIARGLGGRNRTTDSTLDALNYADWGWGGPTAAGVMVGQASAMQVSSVYACVNILSYDIAKLGAAIFQGERHGKSTKLKS